MGDAQLHSFSRVPSSAWPVQHSAVAMVLRIISLAAVALALATWRLSLNHGPAPQFFHNANRVARMDDPIARRLSIAWLWVRHSTLHQALHSPTRHAADVRLLQLLTV